MNPEVAKRQISSLSDEEIAKISDLRANPEKIKREDPTPEGYTPIMEKMDQLIDRIGIAENAIVGVFLDKKSRQKLKFKPVPRPKTKYDQLVDDLVWQYERQDADSIKKLVGF